MTDTNTITSSSTLPYKCPPLIDLSPEKEITMKYLFILYC